VNVNTVNAGVPTSDEIANSNGKPSSGSRNKYLYLWVALAAAMMVAVQYGVALAVVVGVTMGSSSGGSGGGAYDSSFCSTFGGADGAKREVERIVALASSWYSRSGLCVQLQLISVEGKCNSRSNPYNRGDIESGCDGDGMRHGMLQCFENYWHTNRSNVSRDAAHLFRTQAFTDLSVGCAHILALCSVWAYGFQQP
jgi:hypothetical protein